MPEYTYRTVPTKKQAKVYRCKVVGKTDATLQVGRRMLKVQVRETSGTGFTIGVDPKLAKRIKTGRRYDLRYDDRRIQVYARAYVESVHGEFRLLADTVREYEPKERWAFRLPFTKGRRIVTHDLGISSGAVYGGFVLVLFCALALPGIGDRLGTAKRIESALKLMGRNMVDVYQAFRY
jgi:hypothetical protein